MKEILNRSNKKNKKGFDPQIWSGPRLIVDYIKAVVSRAIEAERRYQGSIHIDFCEEIDFSKVYNVESFLAALKLKNAR